MNATPITKNYSRYDAIQEIAHYNHIPLKWFHEEGYNKKYMIRYCSNYYRKWKISYYIQMNSDPWSILTLIKWFHKLIYSKIHDTNTNNYYKEWAISTHFIHKYKPLRNCLYSVT